MLKNEVNEVFDLLDKYQVSEDVQRRLLFDGLYFNYTYGDPDYNHENRNLNFLQVGKLIKYLESENIPFDINEIISVPYMFAYQDLVKKIADNEESIVIIKVKK